jgi:hypothetical protein
LNRSNESVHLCLVCRQRLVHASLACMCMCVIVSSELHLFVQETFFFLNSTLNPKWERERTEGDNAHHGLECDNCPLVLHFFSLISSPQILYSLNIACCSITQKMSLSSRMRTLSQRQRPFLLRMGLL